MAPVPKPRRQRTRHFFKEWREFRELTQERACERLGWQQSKLSRIETGLTPYNQDDLEIAAFAYSCSPADLLTVNPLVAGDVIDLMRLMKNKDPDTIRAFLQALPDSKAN